MCNIVDFGAFKHLAEGIQPSLDSVDVRAVHLNPAASGASCGMVFGNELGYDTILWVRDHITCGRCPYHVWYEATFDEDGDLVAISSCVRPGALDTHGSSLSTLMAGVAALTAPAHVRFQACGKRAWCYMVYGGTRPIAELSDLVALE